ncbi:LaeA-like methyltransferase [Aspergillus crustosus]
MINTQDKYVFGRGQKESERLNAQHKLLSKVTKNTLIHPSISKESLIAVADVGTGTGIWLKDVSKILDNPKPQPYLHGFDISAAQFPTESPADNPRFSVHDITLPFPEEHWNRYDLVHVRLLVAALEETEYKTAIANLSAILSMNPFIRMPHGSRQTLIDDPEPGGSLQWEEIDSESYSLAPPHPILQEIHRCFSLALPAEGKCFTASAKIYEECIAAGFLDVEKLDYRFDADPKIEVELRLATESRLAATIETLYASLLVRSGKVGSEEEARKKAEELKEEHWRLCNEGISPPLKVMRVVARKP